MSEVEVMVMDEVRISTTTTPIMKKKNVTTQANPTSTKYGRNAGFIKGDPHLNWKDAFWGVWALQKQNCAGFVEAQSRKYIAKFRLGHDRWYQSSSACPLERWWGKPHQGS